MTKPGIPKQQMFRVKNNREGLRFIASLRRSLDADWTLRLRGRIADVPKLRAYALASARPEYRKAIASLTDTQIRRRYQAGIPWKQAKEIGIYIVRSKRAAQAEMARERAGWEARHAREEERIREAVRKVELAWAADLAVQQQKIDRLQERITDAKLALDGMIAGGR